MSIFVNGFLGDVHRDAHGVTVAKLNSLSQVAHGVMPKHWAAISRSSAGTGFPDRVRTAEEVQNAAWLSIMLPI